MERKFDRVMVNGREIRTDCENFVGVISIKYYAETERGEPFSVLD